MPAPVPIIDIHCHTAGIGAGASGCFVSRAMRRNVRFHFFLKAFGVTERELIELGDTLVLERLSQGLAESHRVSAAVVLAMDGVVDRQGRLDKAATEIYIPNEFLARECRRLGNLLFGASVNPYRPDALERLDRITAYGAVLLKWLPAIQGIDPADRRLAPFYRRLRELELPLLSHTGNEESFTRSDNSLADPLRLRRALDEGVTVIAAHCASNGRNDGQSNLERLLPLFTTYPNLYADLSSLTQANRLGHLPRVLQHVEIYERLLYGSDMPIINSFVTSPWWHAYRLPLAETRRIVAIRNPWDRDVELKRALGVTEEMLGNSGKLLAEKGKLKAALMVKNRITREEIVS
ncbi:amidohydrolase family protein [Geobacter sp. SVR]|uniref:amidohydrolase family protein n=1 Tax=Geobacter sp. SVR TaxID=2495594 RepID=UPI00143EFF9C|nr:amidohydrolase family protein [Geobacter sp. SVR]BCS53348.1 metal-dependent hydrolase [Geobacter sp. SVR]GCF85526.1 metal-dependent hydrolase [Geobacter sp. SVR]